MPSKIDSLNTSATGSGTPAPVARIRGASPGGVSDSPAQAPGDVHITDTATQLAALEEALRDAPAVDQARVAQLRATIEQGQYTIRPEHIASQLLQLEAQLGQLAPGPKTVGPAPPASNSAES